MSEQFENWIRCVDGKEYNHPIYEDPSWNWYIRYLTTQGSEVVVRKEILDSFDIRKSVGKFGTVLSGLPSERHDSLFNLRWPRHLNTFRPAVSFWIYLDENPPVPTRHKGVR